jgi:hypothetical protein
VLARTRTRLARDARVPTSEHESAPIAESALVAAAVDEHLCLALDEATSRSATQGPNADICASKRSTEGRSAFVMRQSAPPTPNTSIAVANAR